MERSHLDQMISELSLESDFDAKAQEIIDGFELQRIEKYLTVARAINQVRLDLEEEDFEEKFNLLIEASEKEFGVALQILELEKRMDFTYEYSEQVRLLEKIGLLQTLPDSGKLGITGIDQKEYPIPTIAEIAKTISEEKGNLIVKKMGQGFESLIIVPFALPLDEFIKPYTKILRGISLAVDKLLYSSRGNPLEIDYDHPIQIGPSYYAHEDHLIYYPQSLSENKHGGKTKRDLLEKGFGWGIKLIENMRRIPNEEDGFSIGGRECFTTNKLPSEYLRLLQTDAQYQGEQGLTIEDWIMMAINRLEMNRFQIDSIPLDNGCLNLGTYLKNLNSVSKAMYRFSSVSLEFQNNNKGSDLGIRTSVQIS